MKISLTPAPLHINENPAHTPPPPSTQQTQTHPASQSNSALVLPRQHQQSTASQISTLMKLQENNATDDQKNAAISIQSAIRGYQTRKNVSVSQVVPQSGIVHVKLNGNKDFFDKLGMKNIDTSNGKKRVEYLSISTNKYTPHLAGGKSVYNITASTNKERKKILSANQTENKTFFQKIFSKQSSGPTAYINGSFYNVQGLGIANNDKIPKDADISQYKTHSSIGESQIMGVNIPPSIPPRGQYEADFHKMMFPNGSFLTSGPLLSAQDSQTNLYTNQFTEDKAIQKKYIFSIDANLPGNLSHAEHPNPRSAINVPGQSDPSQPTNDRNPTTAKTNNIRMVVAVDDGTARGASSQGLTMVDFAKVMTRLGSFNENPGPSLNLDGGSSTVMGVIDKKGKKIMETVGVSGGGQTAANFIAVERNAKPSATLNRIKSLLKLQNS